MSVINQMLAGLDKSAQQQVDAEQCGAVIVAAPKQHNKAVILLSAVIVVLVGLVVYLWAQSEPPIIIANNSPQVAISSTTLDSNDEYHQLMTTPVLEDTLDKPITHKTSAAIMVIPPPVNSHKTVVSDVVAAPVVIATKTAVIPPATAVHTAKKVKPVPIVKPQPVAKKAPIIKADDNNISIKTVSRTLQQQVQLYAKQAEAALLAGDKERAKTLFSKVLRLDKQHDLSRDKLAAILYGEQRVKSAVKLLQAGLSISPEYTNFRLMLARIYLKNNNKSQAYYYLKPHQPKVAGNVDYYAVLAGLAQNLNDLDTALVAYKKLAQHEPNRAKWWLGLGISADKSKQVDVALNAYHTAQNMGQLSAASRNYINARIIQLEAL